MNQLEIYIQQQVNIKSCTSGSKVEVTGTVTALNKASCTFLKSDGTKLKLNIRKLPTCTVGTTFTSDLGSVQVIAGSYKKSSLKLGERQFEIDLNKVIDDAQVVKAVFGYVFCESMGTSNGKVPVVSASVEGEDCKLVQGNQSVKLKLNDLPSMQTSPFKVTAINQQKLFLSVPTGKITVSKPQQKDAYLKFPDVFIAVAKYACSKSSVAGGTVISAEPEVCKVKYNLQTIDVRYDQFVYKADGIDYTKMNQLFQEAAEVKRKRDVCILGQRVKVESASVSVEGTVQKVDDKVCAVRVAKGSIVTFLFTDMEEIKRI
jgi:hypothetical protein